MELLLLSVNLVPKKHFVHVSCAVFVGGIGGLERWLGRDGGRLCIPVAGTDPCWCLGVEPDFNFWGGLLQSADPVTPALSAKL